ncbi:EAL domain-containing protein [Vibrio genomosp. F6]|nr:EAL domain-containing protein [Vibrio genomosp. F6]
MTQVFFPILRENQNKIIPEILLQLTVFIVILTSFQISVFFTLIQEKSQVLSFTSAFIFAFLFTKGAKTLVGICLSLFTYYYLLSGRDIISSVEISLFFPLVSYFFVTLYQYIKAKIEPQNYTFVLTSYVLVVGFLYPIFNSSLFLLYSVKQTSLLSTPDLMLLAIIGGNLTHLILTPLLIIMVSALTKNQTVPFLDIDNEMLKSRFKSSHYWYWLATCLAGMLTILFINNSIILNTVCLISLYCVAVGLGRFGLIRPFAIAATVVVLAVHNSVQRFNLKVIDTYQFYDQLVVFAIIAALIFLLAGHSIRTYLTTKSAIEHERRDPYTGIYNLSQLKEDLNQHTKVVLIYIDLEATLSKTLCLGHKGRAQFLKNLSEHLGDRITFISRSYLPPFSSGLLCYLPVNERVNVQNEIDALLLSLKHFQFIKSGHSIELVKRSLICTEISTNNNIESIVSLLCEQYTSNRTKVLWLDSCKSSSTQVDKLSFIQEAFKNDDFELFCQPYKKLGSNNNQEYFEVLLRLNSAHQRHMIPASFFPLIFKFGLEKELDKWVVEHTFKSLNEYVINWSQIGRCSINLTATSLNFVELADQIIDYARIYSVPLNKICFEITESMALHNEDIAIQTIEKLREAGCCIALDDFGTGYASFDYLRRLPLDVLKIDGSFIKNITTNPTDVKLVQAMSQVASSMNLVTVAEFVESEQHTQILEQLDIDFAQGFGISKPLPLKTHLEQTQTANTRCA